MPLFFFLFGGMIIRLENTDFFSYAELSVEWVIFSNDRKIMGEEVIVFLMSDVNDNELFL